MGDDAWNRDKQMLKHTKHDGGLRPAPDTSSGAHHIVVTLSQAASGDSFKQGGLVNFTG